MIFAARRTYATCRRRLTLFVRPSWCRPSLPPSWSPLTAALWPAHVGARAGSRLLDLVRSRASRSVAEFGLLEVKGGPLRGPPMVEVEGVRRVASGGVAPAAMAVTFSAYRSHAQCCSAGGRNDSPRPGRARRPGPRRAWLQAVHTDVVRSVFRQPTHDPQRCPFSRRASGLTPLVSRGAGRAPGGGSSCWLWRRTQTTLRCCPAWACPFGTRRVSPPFGARSPPPSTVGCDWVGARRSTS
jgi:hypothetical protein